MAYTLDQKYAIATALADDLAEAYVASSISDMMITGSREKAKAIRSLSEANTDQGNRAVQEYRSTQTKGIARCRNTGQRSASSTRRCGICWTATADTSW